MTEHQDGRAVEVAVVIVNFRSTPLLIRCLETIEMHGLNEPGIEVLVCENASNDGSVDALRREISVRGWQDWVTLVPSAHNRGFTGGNNVLLRRLLNRESAPPFVMLLNPDTEVTPGSIAHLYRAMQSNPGWGAVGPRIEDFEARPQTSCFNDPRPFGEFLRAAQTGPLDRWFARYRTPTIPPHGEGPHDWTSFAAAMIRTAALRQAGIFDEGYFAYYDDPDLCWRLRRCGWTIGHCPQAMIRHLEGASTGVRETRAARRRMPSYQARGRARYFAKRHGIAGLWLANLGWHAGRVISFTRELVERRPSHLPKAQWRDIWTNAFRPWHAPHLPHPPLEAEDEATAEAMASSR